MRLDREQVDDAVVAAHDGCKAFRPAVPRQRRQEAHVAEVDAERRHTAAEQAAQGAQDRAVAAEDEAEVGAAAASSSTTVNPSPSTILCLAASSGGHQQLEPERPSDETQFGEGGVRCLVERSG